MDEGPVGEVRKYCARVKVVRTRRGKPKGKE